MANHLFRQIKRNLPQPFQRRLQSVIDLYHHENSWEIFWDLRSNPNPRRLEIDVTYYCNLKCTNCNRSCGQAPSKEQMSIKQISRFIDECVGSRRQWDSIRVLGGEPSQHPEILEIIEMLRLFRSEHSPQTLITFVTNGLGKKTRKVLAELPEDIIIENSAKTSSDQDNFDFFNIAPLDAFSKKKTVDYSKGCWIVEECGIGLTPFGFYPCAISGSIDRILGLDLGKKSLPASDDQMRDLLATFCQYCGHFLNRNVVWRKQGAEPKMSPIWQKAYAEYEKKVPKLSLY